MTSSYVSYSQPHPKTIKYIFKPPVELVDHIKAPNSSLLTSWHGKKGLFLPYVPIPDRQENTNSQLIIKMSKSSSRPQHVEQTISSTSLSDSDPPFVGTPYDSDRPYEYPFPPEGDSNVSQEPQKPAPQRRPSNAFSNPFSMTLSLEPPMPPGLVGRDLGPLSPKVEKSNAFENGKSKQSSGKKPPKKR